MQLKDVSPKDTARKSMWTEVEECYGFLEGLLLGEQQWGDSGPEVVGALQKVTQSPGTCPLSGSVAYPFPALLGFQAGEVKGWALPYFLPCCATASVACSMGEFTKSHNCEPKNLLFSLV